MIKGPIDIEKQIITQPFSDKHRGVDLRSVDLKTGRLLSVVLPEPAKFLRQGIDRYGNDFAVFLTPDQIELKFIHVTFDRVFAPNEILTGGARLGITQIKNDVFDKNGKLIYKGIGRGNSTAHHLHFETWKMDAPFDSVEYFYQRYIKYDFK